MWTLACVNVTTGTLPQAISGMPSGLAQHALGCLPPATCGHCARSVSALAATAGGGAEAWRKRHAPCWLNKQLTPRKRPRFCWRGQGDSHAARAAGWYPAPAHIPNSGRWNWFHDAGSGAVIPGKAGTVWRCPNQERGVVAKRARLVVMSSTRHITNIKTRGPAHCTAQVRRWLSDRFLFLEGGTEYEYEAKRPFCVRASANRGNAQSAKGTSGNI